MARLQVEQKFVVQIEHSVNFEMLGYVEWVVLVDVEWVGLVDVAWLGIVDVAWLGLVVRTRRIEHMIAWLVHVDCDDYIVVADETAAIGHTPAAGNKFVARHSSASGD